MFNLLITQIVLIQTEILHDKRKVCYEVVNFRRSIVLTSTEKTLHDLSYIKMKIDQVDGSISETQEYILKKQTLSCFEDFTFGKYDIDSQKTNITIHLYPIGFETYFEKFMILLLSYPPIEATSVLGLEGKYELNFNLHNSPTNLDSQEEVYIRSSLPPLSQNTKYCVFGLTEGFLGFYNVEKSSVPHDIFGQIIIELTQEENGRAVTKDSFFEPIELIPCDKKTKGRIHIFYITSKRSIFRFMMEINGKILKSNSYHGDEESDKFYMFPYSIQIHIFYDRIPPLSESATFNSRTIVLIDEKRRTVPCEVNGHDASYTVDKYAHSLIRNRSFRFRAIDTEEKYLVAGRMDLNEKKECDKWVSLDVLSKISPDH